MIDEVLEYVPVIGDIYRYGKLGYKIGSWFANDETDYNDRVLSDMVKCINKAANSGDEIEALNYINAAVQIIKELDTGNCKKYQIALLYYLAARVFHIFALCECIIHKDNLKDLKQVSTTFSQAKGYCGEVWEIKKTLFTTNRELIDQIRQMAGEKHIEINESIEKYRKQYRFLYKKTHPIKWYLGMWMFV